MRTDGESHLSQSAAAAVRVRACVVRPVIDRPLTMDVSLEIILGSSRSSHSGPGVCWGTAGGEEEC